MSDKADADKEEWNRLLKEEIRGVIPATVTAVQHHPIFGGKTIVDAPCGIVFATNVLIIASLMNFKDIRFAMKTAKDRYYALQREWSRFEHKPASAILTSKNYRNYILPYRDVTHVGAHETGRFRKRCTLVFHTETQDFVFKISTSEEIVAKDLTGLLRKSGVRFSPGGMQDPSTDRES